MLRLETMVVHTFYTASLGQESLHKTQPKWVILLAQQLQKHQRRKMTIKTANFVLKYHFNESTRKLKVPSRREDIPQLSGGKTQDEDTGEKDHYSF